MICNEKLKIQGFAQWACVPSWELPGNYPVSTVVMVIYHYVERIWKILVTPNFSYNIYNQESLSSRTSEYTDKIINKYYPRENLGN